MNTLLNQIQTKHFLSLSYSTFSISIILILTALKYSRPTENTCLLRRIGYLVHFAVTKAPGRNSGATRSGKKDKQKSRTHGGAGLRNWCSNVLYHACAAK